MKQPLRYFSIGLFSAAIVLLIGLFFSDTEKVEDLAAEELIPYVEQEGYHVLSNKEYIALSVNNTDENEQPKESTEDKENTSKSNKDSQEKTSKETNNTDKADSKKENNKEKDKNDNVTKDKKDEVVTHTLIIEAGMVPSSISTQLEENNIIEDAFEFDQYLEENDYSKYVQLGEFEVTSDMSFYEIAEKITN